MEGNHYLVYEIVNLKLSEIVVGISRTPLETVLLSDPEVEPARWESEDRVVRRVVEKDLSLDQAAAFALNYSASEALSPLTVYLAGVPRQA